MTSLFSFSGKARVDELRPEDLMQSFIASNSLVQVGGNKTIQLKRKTDGSHRVQVMHNLIREACYWWPNYQIEPTLFKREYIEFYFRIESVLARLSELRRYKAFVIKSQKNKTIDYDVLNDLWELHEKNPFSAHLSSLFDFLWYGKSDKYGCYEDDFYVDGTREIDCIVDDFVEDVDEHNIEWVDEAHYAMYPGSYTEVSEKKKKQKEVHIDIHKECLHDIEKHTNELQLVRKIQRERYNYCMFAALTHINRKTSNNWHVVSMIIDFL